MILKSLTALGLVLALGVSISGCSQKGRCVGSGSTKLYYDEEIDFDYAARKNVEALVKNPTERMVIADFVELSSLDKSRRFGLVLSNKLKNALTKSGQTRVIEVETSKYFKMGQNGLKLLSRNADELRNTHADIHYALVGTYTITSDRVIIFSKLLDMKDGSIAASHSYEMPMTCEIASLLKR